MAARLSHCLRTSDALSRAMPNTAARLGGDEFTVLLSEIHTENEAAIVAQRILENLGQADALRSEHEVIVTPSIGIAVFPRMGRTRRPCSNCRSGDVFREARGQEPVPVLYAAMNEVALRRLTMENSCARPWTAGTSPCTTSPR